MNESEMRALDAWLAENAMGWEKVGNGWVARSAAHNFEMRWAATCLTWRPTADWACTGMLLDKMAEDGWEVRIGSGRVLFQATNSRGIANIPDGWATVKLAISLAARKAWEAKHE